MNEKNQRTIERIRYGYEEHEATKTEQLKALDREVRRPVNVFAWTFGSVSALVFGTGMCMSMQVILQNLHPAIGIAVGLAGAGLCVLNYFIHKSILKKRKNKYAPRVLELCDEALNCEVQADECY